MFSPEGVAQEFSDTLKSYGTFSCVGDKYAGMWAVEQFQRFGISYQPVADPKSTLYSTFLAAVNSKRVELLDSLRLLNQIVSLERRTSRNGRDQIDHPPGGHDDLANAVAGVVAITLTEGGYDSTRGWVDEKDATDPLGLDGWRQLRLQTYLNSHGNLKLWFVEQTTKTSLSCGATSLPPCC